MLAYTLGATVAQLKSEGNLAGVVLENFVLLELRKQGAWSTTRPKLCYWRTASGQEVDIVLEDRSGKVAGIEAKTAISYTSLRRIPRSPPLYSLYGQKSRRIDRTNVAIGGRKASI